MLALYICVCACMCLCTHVELKRLAELVLSFYHVGSSPELELKPWGLTASARGAILLAPSLAFVHGI